MAQASKPTEAPPATAAEQSAAVEVATLFAVLKSSTGSVCVGETVIRADEVTEVPETPASLNPAVKAEYPGRVSLHKTRKAAEQNLAELRAQWAAAARKDD